MFGNTDVAAVTWKCSIGSHTSHDDPDVKIQLRGRGRGKSRSLADSKYCRVIVISLSRLLDSAFIVMSNINRFLEVQGVAVEQRSAPRVGLKLKNVFLFQ